MYAAWKPSSSARCHSPAPLVPAVGRGGSRCSDARSWRTSLRPRAGRARTRRGHGRPSRGEARAWQAGDPADGLVRGLIRAARRTAVRAYAGEWRRDLSYPTARDPGLRRSAPADRHRSRRHPAARRQVGLRPHGRRPRRRRGGGHRGLLRHRPPGPLDGRRQRPRPRPRPGHLRQRRRRGRPARRPRRPPLRQGPRAGPAERAGRRDGCCARPRPARCTPSSRRTASTRSRTTRSCTWRSRTTVAPAEKLLRRGRPGRRPSRC